MASPIGTIPQGLLSMLALKQTGANPSNLLNDVAPNIDLTRFYLERLVQTEVALFGGLPQTAAQPTGSHGFINFQLSGANVAVPNNETWFVVNAGFTINSALAAADNIVAQVGWNVAPFSGESYALCAVARDTTTANVRTIVSDPMPSPVWLPPGATFQLFLWNQSSGAGSYVYNLALRAARLLV